MIHRTLARAALMLELVAGVTLVTLGGRFALSGVAFAIERRAPKGEGEPEKAPNVHGAAGPRASGSGKQPSASPPAPELKRTKIPTARLGTSLRLPLMVNVGTRSDVYVNGTPVGQTPYLGEVTCKAGGGIRIEVVPKEGVPTTYQRRCVPGSTLRVTEE